METVIQALFLYFIFSLCVIIHHQDVTENHVLDQVYNTIVKPAILIVAEVSGLY